MNGIFIPKRDTAESDPGFVLPGDYLTVIGYESGYVNY